MTTLKNPHLVSLSTFLQDKSHIQLTTSASPEYHNLREIWALDNTSTPLAIVRPQTSDDVSHLIKFCSSSAIKFTIRSGGHNIFGSSIVQDALCIDLRSLKHVFISSSKTTATIGGGILINELAKELQKEGLVAASTEISSVGYVGWASCGGGGYGPFMRNFGLGVDQIIGAKVVDANGEVKDADEKLLKGIRGAGGAFGVIVEMTIKVYPLKEFLAGTVLFESSNLTATFKNFNAGLQSLKDEGIPRELCLSPAVFSSPQGKFCAAKFTWSSIDIETGRSWLAKVEKLGIVIMSTVSVTTAPTLFEQSTSMIPSSVYGAGRAHMVRGLTNKTVEILARNLELMPNTPPTFLSIHDLTGGPLSTATEDSVQPRLGPHCVIEMMAFTPELKDRDAAVAWADKTWMELKDGDPENILDVTAFGVDLRALPGKGSLKRIYGENTKDVLDLKAEFDKDNVFDLAYPRVREYV